MTVLHLLKPVFEFQKNLKIGLRQRGTKLGLNKIQKNLMQQTATVQKQLQKYCN